MPISRFTLSCGVAICVLFAGAAAGAPFADAVGEQAGDNNSEVDIAAVEVTRDLTNLNFKINLAGDISTADFGNYLIGIQTTPGGSTELNNPWSKPIGIGSGMNYWVGSWVNFGGGAEVYAWDGAGWARTGQTITPVLAPDSTTISIPLIQLGLEAGGSFKFDVWSTYGAPGGQSAYDALNNPQETVAEPWNGTPYDSAAGPLATFTVRDADANSDGAVGFSDLVALAQNYGAPGGATWAQGDFDGDGAVSFQDLVMLAQNYGQGAPAPGGFADVPEPSSFGLLVLSLMLGRRRK